MKQPKVTVLITVKNNVETIKMCIDSLLNQTYKNYEIFVVDAFSNDGTYEILKSYGKKIKLHQLKGWAPKAYNWAIKRIKSDFIAFTDGDCKVDKKWIKELVNGFKTENVLAVAGFYTTLKDSSPLQKVIGIELGDRYKTFGKYISQSPTANLCLRTKTAKRFKFDDKMRISFDPDLTFRLAKAGKIQYNKKAVVYHYHRASWRAVLKQQYLIGVVTPQLYVRHPSKATGANISKLSMIVQPVFFYIALLSMLLSIFFDQLIFLAAFLILLIVLIWFYDTAKLRKNSKKLSLSLFLGYFFVRFLGWIIGLPVGIVRLFKLYFK